MGQLLSKKLIYGWEFITHFQRLIVCVLNLELHPRLLYFYPFGVWLYITKPEKNFYSNREGQKMGRQLRA